MACRWRDGRAAAVRCVAIGAKRACAAHRDRAPSVAAPPAAPARPGRSDAAAPLSVPAGGAGATFGVTAFGLRPPNSGSLRGHGAVERGASGRERDGRRGDAQPRSDGQHTGSDDVFASMPDEHLPHPSANWAHGGPPRTAQPTVGAAVWARGCLDHGHDGPIGVSFGGRGQPSAGAGFGGPATQAAMPPGFSFPPQWPSAIAVPLGMPCHGVPPPPQQQQRPQQQQLWLLEADFLRLRPSQRLDRVRSRLENSGHAAAAAAPQRGWDCAPAEKSVDARNALESVLTPWEIEFFRYPTAKNAPWHGRESLVLLQSIAKIGDEAIDLLINTRSTDVSSRVQKAKINKRTAELALLVYDECFGELCWSERWDPARGPHTFQNRIIAMSDRCEHGGRTTGSGQAADWEELFMQLRGTEVVDYETMRVVNASRSHRISRVSELMGTPGRASLALPDPPSGGARKGSRDIQLDDADALTAEGANWAREFLAGPRAANGLLSDPRGPPRGGARGEVRGAALGGARDRGSDGAEARGQACRNRGPMAGVLGPLACPPTFDQTPHDSATDEDEDGSLDFNLGDGGGKGGRGDDDGGNPANAEDALAGLDAPKLASMAQYMEAFAIPRLPEAAAWVRALGKGRRPTYVCPASVDVLAGCRKGWRAWAAAHMQRAERAANAAARAVAGGERGGRGASCARLGAAQAAASGAARGAASGAGASTDGRRAAQAIARPARLIPAPDVEEQTARLKKVAFAQGMPQDKIAMLVQLPLRDGVLTVVRFIKTSHHIAKVGLTPEDDDETHLRKLERWHAATASERWKDCYA